MKKLCESLLQITKNITYTQHFSKILLFSDSPFILLHIHYKILSITCCFHIFIGDFIASFKIHNF